MTALSSEAHNGATNGYTNGSAEHNNNNHSQSTTEVSGTSAFANNAFSHLTLYTGNTMRTGTTGQLNTSLKKSNQETVQEEKRPGTLWGKKECIKQPSLDNIASTTFTDPPGNNNTRILQG